MEVQQEEKDVWSKVRYFLCRYCREKGAFKQTWSVASTGGADYHLRKKHNVYPEGETC
jgi:hypothetical protein